MPTLGIPFSESAAPLAGITRRRIEPAVVIAWSTWRRCHQALAKTRPTDEQRNYNIRPYVRGLRGLAARPATCPNRGLRRTGRRRASDMEGGRA
ncbi:hypothetical protein D9623_16390 [Azospirillum brasilense]|uniref:Uncharacterized protein n=1 Tax=Azospirillum brasilense TaxID=192 RepID=A0A4D8QN48_AZOBR|nr:hypothetical protein D3868_14265 [Azospirillum brasilense]QEL91722.1 hypothetical protein D9621_16170 [Azospirillum brasilense]QEL98017.1 hypothetical protein D9623_16390 [Azospirillum brasilense]